MTVLVLIQFKIVLEHVKHSPFFLGYFRFLLDTYYDDFKLMGWQELGCFTSHLHGLIEGDESVHPEMILSVKRDGKLTETDV